MLLENRVAMITGGARGMGRAIALRYADEGCDSVIVDMLDKDGEKTVKDIKAKGREAMFIHCDVSNSKQVKETVAKAIAKFKKIDILVNNAGVTAQDRFTDMPLRRWNLIINVNLNGSAYCAHAVLPQMMERNSGVVINMSSILALRVQYSVPYGATKAAVERMTTGLAREMRRTNISITAMRPFFVKTEVVSEFLDGRSDTSDWEEPEMWGKYCAEIAAADPSITTGKIFDQALCKETFGPWR